MLILGRSSGSPSSRFLRSPWPDGILSIRMRSESARTSRVAKSERQRHRDQVDRVIHVVESILRDADADLYNWADEAIRTDAMQALYALGKITAELADQLALATNRPAEEALHTARSRVFDVSLPADQEPLKRPVTPL